MKTINIFKSYFIFLAATLTIVNTQKSYSAENDGNKYSKNSILSSGKWIKLEVKENAIYKLTYEDIQKMGLNPANAKIFGYGGWILDEYYSNYIDDLPKVPVWISGSDNKLDAGEFMLFYGKGTVKWNYSGVEYEHENNPYSTYGSYFITDSQGTGNEKLEKRTASSTSSITLTTFDDYMLHEKEETSIIKTGRELFGESFTNKNIQSFPFAIPGITSAKGIVKISFAASVSANTELKISVNNTDLKTLPITSSSTPTAIDSRIEWPEGSKSDQTTIGINFMGGTQLSYLNYIRLNMTRELKYYDTGYTLFRNKENKNYDVQYNISNAKEGLIVLDVTNYNNIYEVNTVYSNGILSFKSPNGSIREFALIDPVKSFNVPKSLGNVENQNLHGLSQIDMAIISPKAFVSEAERLAQAHKNKSGLEVVVVTPEQIYNEFSSGAPDASAYRFFMKMFYDRAETDKSKHPKYLLLFGDGIFDNRFIDKVCSSFNKENFLLSYQVKQSLDKNTSYSCDDFFGFLNEKDVDNLSKPKAYSARTLNLGIGRFPIQTLSGAKKAVDKTISYMNNTNRGIWKNTVVFLADDTDSNVDNDNFTQHMKQADSVAYHIMQKLHPEYITTKIYMDAYQAETSGGKVLYDNTAKKKLMNSLENGCLMVNYTGHGNTRSLGHAVVTSPEIQQYKYKTLPLWITATCDFGPFDEPSTSAGELAFLSEKSGAIALFTTTRIVYANDNVKLNLRLTKNLFEKEDGSYPALGDVLRDSKNQLGSNDNKMNYILLGDPALKLNYPEYEIVVDKINDQPVEKDKTYTFQALESVSVSGYIKNESGAIDHNFNGPLSINIFDGLQNTQTVSYKVKNNSITGYSYFTDYPSLIYSGYNSIKNGSFDFKFTVNLDIAETQNLGKMNFYATSTDENGTEAKGYFEKYNLFGTNPDAELNENGPSIERIFLNSEAFKPESVVNATPYLVVDLKDQYGINVSGAGIGHDIELIIDHSPYTTYNLNNYYKPSIEDPAKGTLEFSIPQLPEGKHSLTFRAWNIMNNSTVTTFDFYVKSGIAPVMSDLRVKNNPIKLGETAYFEFQHNMPATLIESTIHVFDISGRPVWNHTETGSSDLMSAYEIPWDLISESGSNLQPGVYIYKATIKTPNGTESTNAKKMIIVAQ